MSYDFEYKINGIKYPVIVEKKNNKNTYIKIKEDMTIYVTTNFLTSKWQIKNMLDSEKKYLEKAIASALRKHEKEKEFYYLGKKYDIIIVSFDKVEIDDNKIYAPSKETLEKWLKKQTLKVFNERLEYNYNLFKEDIPFPKLKMRKMKTRWGVCNKRDNSITLNTKLIRYSLKEIDYVIIHELSHFVHFDHSREFWNTVEKYMPSYKESIKVLKEQ